MHSTESQTSRTMRTLLPLLVLIALPLCTCLAKPSEAELRTWTSPKGKSAIRAKLHSFSEGSGQVVLDVDGRGLKVVSLTSFSEEDKAYILEVTMAPKPQTTEDLDIPLDQLKLRVKPLTKDEVKVEADAWFELLRSKAVQVSASQVGVKKTNEAMDAAEGDATTALKAVQEAEQVTQEAEAKAAETEAELTDNENRQGEKSSEEPVTNSGDVAEQAEGKKDQLLVNVNELRDQKTALSDRLKIVLDAYDAKGGDSGEYRAYLASVSGIEVDVTDASATWSAVTGWLTSEEGGYRWGFNLLVFLFILLSGWILSLVVALITRRLVNRSSNISVMARNFVVATIRRTVLAIAFLVGLAALEVNIAPLLAALGATGFIVGFALQGTLSNFASGLMIIVYRPFDTGDLVEAGGITGLIDEMNLVSTTFKTLDNQRIIVPNNSIWGSVIRNFTAHDIRRVDMTFGIGYGDSIEHAETVINDILANHELVLTAPEAVVRVHELADSSVNFTCRPWAKTSDFWTVYWDVTRAVKTRFDEEGISIPFPQQDVHVHNSVPVAVSE